MWATFKKYFYKLVAKNIFNVMNIQMKIKELIYDVSKMYKRIKTLIINYEKHKIFNIYLWVVLNIDQN